MRVTPSPGGAFRAPADDVRACRSRLRTMLLRLAPTGRSLRIETDDAAVEQYVRTAYGKLLVPTPIQATDHALFLTSTAPETVCFNCVPLKREWSKPGNNPWESSTYVVDQFVWRTLAPDPEWMSLYGCAVVHNGRAVLLVGRSGAGKTTLGLALHRLGARVIGDEMILIRRRDAVVVALDRRLSVRWGGHDPLGDESLATIIREKAALVNSGPAGFLAVDRSALGAVPRPAKLAATFVVTRGNGEPRVAAASLGRTALTIASYLGARPQGLGDVADFAGVLDAGRCFTLDLGEPNASARAVLEALG